MSFNVKIINYPNGEQLPLLVDRDGLPVVLPNEFILGRRHLSINTLSRNLREIAIFWTWLEKEKVDLGQMIALGRSFGEAHIVGGLVNFLRREKGIGKRVQKLVVAPLTFNQRLTTIRQFIEWCFDVELSHMTNMGIRYTQLIENKANICRQLSSCFLASTPIKQALRKGLLDSEYQQLVEVLKPLPESAATKANAVAFRNYISTVIMLNYGLRPGELLSLRIEDVELGG